MATDLVPVLDVVERVYDALADRFRWPAAIESIRRLVHGDAAFLLVGPTTEAWTCIASSGLSAADSSSYADHWRVHDPALRHTAVADSSRDDIRQWRRLDREESAFFLHFTAAQPWQAALVAISAADGLAVVIWSARPNGFDAAHVAALRHVWPHVRRGWSLQSSPWRPSAAHVRAVDRGCDEGLPLLEHWPVGVVRLTVDGAVTYANQRAQALAESRDGFGFAIDGPIGHSVAETRRLRTAIRAIAEKVSAEQWLRLHRPSRLPPYEVSLRASRPAPAGDSEIAMFVSDPNQRPLLSEEALQALHGLTPAEAAVARRVTHGASAETIAKELDISHRTTRWHLEQLRGKLSVSNQADLVRVLLSPIALTAADTSAPGKN